MCGITGFINITGDKEDAARQAIGAAMAQAITHRGPDGQDIWQERESGVVLTHRRLAIIDLSDGGKQPMMSPSGRYVVTYNGEIYNYRELKSELETQGCIFKSESDTEVMLMAFDRWGIDTALKKLNGMFAIALWDRQEKYIHFMRDRFGKKPLYIGWAGNDLVFGSELKSFHAHPDFKADMNRDILALYMRYGYVHAPHCIYQNMWQVMPAGRVSLDVSSLQAGANLVEKNQTYWSLRDVTESGVAAPLGSSERDIIDGFEGLLNDAVSRRMLSDVPLGAFLSGGIDSSVVVALMQKNSAQAVKTFSIGFEEKGFNEAEHAKEIARHLGTDHHEFYVSDQDAQAVIPKLADIYDEPFADQSQIPTYLISRLARDHVTVALTGDGGDEILAGYDRHTKVADAWSKIGWMPQPARQIICGLAGALPESFYGTISGNPQLGAKIKRLLKLMGLKDAAAVYDALVSVRQNNIVLNGEAPLIPLKDPEHWPSGLNFSEQMMFGDMLSYRPNDVMVKADRASMAVALELRAPLMDDKLAEYCWRVPHHMKLRGGQGKWLLRQVLKRYVPETLYERPKMGFSVPLDSWLRGSLKSWGDDLLSHDRLKRQGLFDADVLSKEWQDFQMGKDTHVKSSQAASKSLWSALMFQSWYDRWSK